MIFLFLTIVIIGCVELLAIMYESRYAVSHIGTLFSLQNKSTFVLPIEYRV